RVTGVQTCALPIYEVGPRVTRPEDDRRPPLAELAAPTAREGPRLRAERLLRGEQVVARERERREAEVAVVAERGAERAERLGERLPGIRRGHPATRAPSVPSRRPRRRKRRSRRR